MLIFLDLFSFCWKDCFIHAHDGELNSEALAQQYDRSKLSRTELSTLIGLACKNGFSQKTLTKEELEALCNKAWDFLEKLHSSFYFSVELNKLFKNNS